MLFKGRTIICVGGYSCLTIAKVSVYSTATNILSTHAGMQACMHSTPFVGVPHIAMSVDVRTCVCMCTFVYLRLLIFGKSSIITTIFGILKSIFKRRREN